MIVLGIDGGGSSTRAVLANETGMVLGRGASGPSNPLSVGIEQCSQALEAAVAAAWATARTDRRPADAAVLGVAGLSGKREQEQVRELATDLALARPDTAERVHTRVTHDLFIALCGGLGNSVGCVLVAGTGSAAFGCGDSGEGAIVGGKGALAGDAGSAYWVAHQALRDALKQLDGRLQRSALADVVLDFLDAQDADQLVRRLAVNRPRTFELARLCPRVVNLASEGDETAARIVGQAQQELADMVFAACQRVGLSKPRVVVNGGLARSEGFRPGLEARIRSVLPDCSFPDRLLPPVGGAVLEALRLAGTDVSDHVTVHLGRQL